MPNRPIQIPDDIAARCSGADQAEQFKRTLRRVLEESSTEPPKPVAPRPRGCPRKAV
jgi:hypothetical protein